MNLILKQFDKNPQHLQMPVVDKFDFVRTMITKTLSPNVNAYEYSIKKYSSYVHLNMYLNRQKRHEWFAFPQYCTKKAILFKWQAVIYEWNNSKDDISKRSENFYLQ